ncbi:T9SS type A sorting domain-containing protein [Saccharicrinis sp. FJH2]|uniref:T9SS type A sorting domain-containing protein n=1 Tax=Saccharicrinis sp. FJH65 TaxID=3344659 RepID=UPI0035F35097
MKPIFTLVCLFLSVIFLNAQTHKLLFDAKLTPSKHTLEHTEFVPTQLESTDSKTGTLDSIVYSGFVGTPPIWLESLEKYEYKYDQYGKFTTEILSTKDTILNVWVPVTKNEIRFNENGNIDIYIESEYGSGNYFVSNKTEYSYNDKELLINEIKTYYSSGVFSYQSKSIYEYDENNFIISKTNYERNIIDGSWEYQGKNIYTLDVDGRITEDIVKDRDMNGDAVITSLDWMKISFEYDENGNKIKESNYYWKSSINDWYESSKTEYEYEGNLMVSTKHFQRNGDSEFIINWYDEFLYDSNGNQISYITKDVEDIEEESWDMGAKYEYDLSKLILDYSTPYLENIVFSDNFKCINKPVSMSYYNIMDLEWNLKFKSIFYYSDDVATSVPRFNNINAFYIQKSKNIQFIWEGSNENLMLEIYNISGKIILEQKIVTNQNISLDSFSNGIYIYRLKCGHNIKSGKFVL